jgi:hypothetical protein
MSAPRSGRSSDPAGRPGLQAKLCHLQDAGPGRDSNPPSSPTSGPPAQIEATPWNPHPRRKEEASLATPGENPGQFRDQTPGYFASRGGSENTEGDPGEKTGGGSGVWKWEMLGILPHAHGRGWNPYHRGACVGRGSGGRGSSHDRRQLVQRVGSASVVAPSPGDEGACRGLEHHAAPQHRAAPLY